jgi:thioredoxin-related protein
MMPNPRRCIEHHLDYRSRECPACEALRLRVENRELRRMLKEHLAASRVENKEMREIVAAELGDEVNDD